jgi:hypothetical protein
MLFAMVKTTSVDPKAPFVVVKRVFEYSKTVFDKTESELWFEKMTFPGL